MSYHEHLKEYIEKHKVSEFVKVNPLLKEKVGFKELTLKYDIEYTSKLAKVDELKKFLAIIMGLHPSALHIVDIKEGCVVVTFLISASVADTIFIPGIAFTPQQEDELETASVLWMKCNGYTLNFGMEKLAEEIKSAGSKKL